MNEKQKIFLSQYGSKEHIDKLIGDRDWGVRYFTSQNPNATKEHLDKLVNDEDYRVRWRAESQMNKRYGS